MKDTRSPSQPHGSTTSLGNRVAIVSVVTTTAWVVALTVLFNVLLAAQLQNESESLLRTRAQAVLSTIRIDDADHLAIREAASDAALDSGVWVFEGARAIDCGESFATRAGKSVGGLLDG